MHAPDEGRNLQWDSVAIRANPCQSVPIRANQSQSEPIRANQSQSEPIKGVYRVE